MSSPSIFSSWLFLAASGLLLLPLNTYIALGVTAGAALLHVLPNRSQSFPYMLLIIVGIPTLAVLVPHPQTTQPLVVALLMRVGLWSLALSLALATVLLWPSRKSL